MSLTVDIRTNFESALTHSDRLRDEFTAFSPAKDAFCPKKAQENKKSRRTAKNNCSLQRGFSRHQSHRSKRLSVVKELSDAILRTTAACSGTGPNLLGYSHRLSGKRKIRIWENESAETSRFGKHARSSGGCPCKGALLAISLHRQAMQFQLERSPRSV